MEPRDLQVVAAADASDDDAAQVMMSAAACIIDTQTEMNAVYCINSRAVSKFQNRNIQLCSDGECLSFYYDRCVFVDKDENVLFAMCHYTLLLGLRKENMSMEFRKHFFG